MLRRANIPLHYILGPLPSIAGRWCGCFGLRVEFPWNVAGIPPEAREAARAAARREGLSVGEWLTRRILRSFSGMDEDAGLSFDRGGASGAPLDSRGLPPSSTR